MSDHNTSSYGSFAVPVDYSGTSATDPRLIAALRLRARFYRAQSIKAADDLVELTLRTAIDEVDSRPPDTTLFKWLSGIMARHHN
jgi:DNA-directed RNA polymerase specialized sigma24 family protein